MIGDFGFYTAPSAVMTDAALRACLTAHKNRADVLELGMKLDHFIIRIPKEDPYKQSCMKITKTISDAKDSISHARDIRNTLNLLIGQTCDMDKELELVYISDELERTGHEFQVLYDRGTKWRKALNNARVVCGDLSCSEEERKGLESGTALLLDGEFEEEVRKGGEEVSDCVDRLAVMGCMIMPGGGGMFGM